MMDHGMRRDRLQLITSLPTRLHSRPLAYALAAALPLAAVGLRLALGFESGDAPAIIFFVIPIIMSAHLGGLGPGLVATGLSGILLDYFLLPPLHSLVITSRLQLIQWAALLLTGVLVSALSEGLYWARRRTEASYRLQSVTLASIGDAVITTDTHGRITFLNPEAERLTGWSLAEAVGQPLASVFRIINASSRAPIESPATKVLQSGSVVSLANHTVLIGRDGRETPIADSGAPIREPNGTVEGVVLVFRDITERERAERDLRESAEWLRLGYDAAGLGIWRHDIETGMIHFDQPARDHYGSDADDAPISDVLRRIHREDRDRLEREIATTTDPASDGRYSTEYRVIHADGSERWLAVQARVIFEGEGSARRPTHGFGTSQDITDRKRAEAALHDTSLRLRVLADTSRAIAEAGTDLQPLLHRIAQAITEMLGDGCSIVLFEDDDEWLYHSAVYDSDPEKESEQRTILGASRLHVSEAAMFAQVLRTDKPLVFSQLELDRVRAVAKPANLVLLERLGIHTGIVVPMHAQGRTIGGMTLYRRQPNLPAFDQEDVLLMQDLADRAALAISNARLLDQVQRELAERTRAEAEVRESEEHLRTVTETAQLGLVIVDQQHRYRYANRAYAAIFSLPASEIVGQRVADVLAPVYEHQIRPRLNRAFGGERVSYELVIPTGAADWRDRYYAVTYEPCIYRLETVVIVVVAEITERKRAELELARSATRLQVLADASRAFAEAGSQYQPLLDQVARTVAEVLGEGCSIQMLSEDAEWLSLVALYDVDPELRDLQRSALSATPLRVDEVSFTTRAFHSRQPLMIPVVDMEAALATTKPEYWSLVERMGVHSMLVAPMRVHGQAIGVLVVNRHLPGQPSFTDDDRSLVQDLADRAALAISNARLLNQVQRELAERTRAEAEVRSLSAELEQRVAERTAELIAANQELESFSYSVSHDLRAPLRAIDGFSRILLEDYVDALPSEAQHYFDLIRSNAQRMGQLVDDLLAFSRLSRQPLRKQTIDPASLIARCLSELRAEQEGRPLEIQIGALPACSADPALLIQVWLNLLANALKYTRQRTPAVIVIDSIIQGAETVYRIVDNGVGFDMRYADKLFGVFQRLHRAEEFEGTGVGLAIVQRIVQRHGGRVWADAAVNKGATFSFTLEGAFTQPT